MRSRTVLLVLVLVMLAVGREMGVSKPASVLAAFAVMGLGLGAVWALRLRRRRPAGDGFRYVHVEPDGSARELAWDEREHLLADSRPADGGRPFVKTWYGSRTRERGMAGYLRRDRLPAEIRIRPAPPEPLRPGTPIR